MAKLTVKALGKILYEEFERDSWGTVDPYYFKEPPRMGEATPENGEGLYEVLERAVNRINAHK